MMVTPCPFCMSIKVTELVDGAFIGCYAIGDGTSYWNFFNTWSEIFQAKAQGHEYDVPISRHSIHNRFEAPLLRERIFHFSAESIAKLKAKANSRVQYHQNIFVPILISACSEIHNRRTPPATRSENKLQLGHK
ncbi:acetyltransferase protein [Spatholobus suberectus]|nr:acetyltransferase protein [Spatholobus suberectus]